MYINIMSSRIIKLKNALKSKKATEYNILAAYIELTSIDIIPYSYYHHLKVPYKVIPRAGNDAKSNRYSACAEANRLYDSLSIASFYLYPSSRGFILLLLANILPSLKEYS